MICKKLTSRCTKHIVTEGLNTVCDKHVLKYKAAETLTNHGTHEGKIQKFIERW